MTTLYDDIKSTLDNDPSLEGSAKLKRDKTLLLRAIRKDCPRSVVLLVEKGADVNIYSKNGRSAFELSLGMCSSGWETAVLAIVAKMDCNASNIDNQTMLCCVLEHCSNVNVDIVKCMIDHGADVNLASLGGETPLPIAMRKRMVEIVRVLLNAGADIRCADDQHTTPLHVAIQTRCEATFDVLMSVVHEKKIEGVNRPDCHGRTPLYMACRNSNLRMIDSILSACSNEVVIATHSPFVACAESDFLEGLHLLLKHRAKFKEVKYLLNDAFCASCVAGNLHLVQHLLESKEVDITEIEHSSANGVLRRVSPLTCSLQSGNMQLLQYLIDSGAKLHPLAEKNALVLLCVHEMRDVVNDLLIMEPNLLNVNEALETCFKEEKLHLMAIWLLKKGFQMSSKAWGYMLSAGHAKKLFFEIVAIDGVQITRNAQCHAPTMKEMPLLCASIVLRQDEVMEAILSRAYPRKDISKETNEEIVSILQTNDVHNVRALLEYGADLDILGNHGQSVLASALLRNSYAFARDLIVCGVDVNVMCRNGTALYYLFKSPTWTNHIDETHMMLKDLLEAGADANLNQTAEEPSVSFVTPLHVLVTPLHVLVQRKYSEVGDISSLMRLMLQYGADPNANQVLLTCLTCNCSNFSMCHGDGVENRAKVVKLLLQSGADVNAVKKGKSAASCCMHGRLMRLLIQYGISKEHCVNVIETILAPERPSYIRTPQSVVRELLLYTQMPARHIEHATSVDRIDDGAVYYTLLCWGFSFRKDDHSAITLMNGPSREQSLCKALCCVRKIRIFQPHLTSDHTIALLAHALFLLEHPLVKIGGLDMCRWSEKRCDWLLWAADVIPIARLVRLDTCVKKRTKAQFLSDVTDMREA